MIAEGMARDRAFLVGVIDTRDGLFKGFGLFSEETPTLPSRLFPFTALRGFGECYEQAICDVGRQLMTPPYAWMLKHTDAKRSLEGIRRAQRRAGEPVLP